MTLHVLTALEPLHYGFTGSRNSSGADIARPAALRARWNRLKARITARHMPSTSIDEDLETFYGRPHCTAWRSALGRCLGLSVYVWAATDGNTEYFGSSILLKVHSSGWLEVGYTALNARGHVFQGNHQP